jgi:outer membrane lipoprotein carrier protein
MRYFYLNKKPVLKTYLLAFTSFMLFGLLSAPGWANDSDRSSLLNLLKLQKNFQSQYQQDIYESEGSLKESAKGYFYLGEKGAFKNDIQQDGTPATTIVSNGEKLWLIDHDLEQVSIYKLESYLDDSPLALLLGEPQKALEAFNIHKVKNVALKQSLFKLNANNQYASVKRLRLGFKKEKIAYVEIDEATGKTVRVDFRNSEKLKNKNIFKPDFGEHYEVVDESH